MSLNTNRSLSAAMVGFAVLAAALLVLVFAASAVAAPGPWWLVQSTASPSYLPVGGSGTVTVMVENMGDEDANGASVPVRIVDHLPLGLEATSVLRAGSGFGQVGGGFGAPLTCSTAGFSVVSCTWSGSGLAPYEPMYIEIAVRLTGAVSGESEVSVSGGGAPPVAVKRTVTRSGPIAPFGVESYAVYAEEEGGSLDTQAGSHPFQFTSALALNQTGSLGEPPALARGLAFALPTGLVGNATVTPRCTDAQFGTSVSGNSDECPADTAIGVASAVVTLNYGGYSVPLVEVVPLFNLEPAPGEPARFGFDVNRVRIALDTSVRTGGDYGVTVASNNTSEGASLGAARVTFWGTPGDPRHNNARGWNCIDHGFYYEEALGEGGLDALEPCTPLGSSQARPLLTLPTSCTGPLQSSVAVTSWPTRTDPEGLSREPFPLSEPAVSLTGCERLQFNPTLSVTPEAQAGGSPTGVGVGIHIPVLENPEGLAEGNLKKAVVTLPEGLVVNPASANGLGACTPAEIGMNNANPVTCPESAKIGTAEAVSPAVHSPFTGSVYVAEQNNNPFGSLLALYLEVEGEGVLIKSAGEVHLDPTTGQVTTTFDNLPQQASSDIRLHLFGGPHAPLSTPAGCGTYTTTSRLTPYNTTTPSEPSSAFQITGGANGTGCGPQGFAPSFTAGGSNSQAAGFGAFSVTLSRQDQEQGLGGVSVTTPPGVLGLLKTVAQCPEPQAAQGTCGPGSLLGHATATAGAGPSPVSVSGQVFLTGPYKGAPFGLSIVVPAAVGPFNLGNVVVRAAVSVDPHTAQITVTSDPLPRILQGVPLQIRTVHVDIDRVGFMFNPTNCEPLSVGGVLSSTQGASAAVSSHFQVTNCATLPFKPVFGVSTQAGTSKKQGASLTVKIGYPQGTQANIHSVAVTLPKQLPARLTTIQQACTQAVFAANPASCPVGSNIGTATATTPVLSNAVSGPVYLVSHGGAAFPDVVLVLQGEGVTLDVVGSIDIKHNITSSTFASIPDAPISGFQLTLPEGPHSGLAAVLPAKAKGSLCGTSLTMPTTLTGQNGAVVKQTTKIAVTGCPRANTRRAHGRKSKVKPTQRAHGRKHAKTKKGGKK
jgi:hypothetical protein